MRAVTRQKPDRGPHGRRSIGVAYHFNGRTPIVICREANGRSIGTTRSDQAAKIGERSRAAALAARLGMLRSSNSTRHAMTARAPSQRRRRRFEEFGQVVVCRLVHKSSSTSPLTPPMRRYGAVSDGRHERRLLFLSAYSGSHRRDGPLRPSSPRGRSAQHRQHVTDLSLSRVEQARDDWISERVFSFCNVPRCLNVSMRFGCIFSSAAHLPPGPHLLNTQRRRSNCLG